MKLQRHISRKIDGKKYEKWVITLPDSLISRLKWIEGNELGAEAQGDLLILRKKQDKEIISEKKQEYFEFKEKVLEGLTGEKEGLTWGELRKKQGLRQAKPFHDWVRALEKDIGLMRQRKGTQIFWRLSK